MYYDSLSIPIYEDEDIIDLLYKHPDFNLENIIACNSKDVKHYNQYAADFYLHKLVIYQQLDLEITEFDKLCQQNWLMPTEYKKIDIKTYLLSKCTTPIEKNRVVEELSAFAEKNLFNLLRYLIFLVDHMRQRQHLWGVGRGSSVASYVLYLIGVHRINSLKFNLDWQEFLR